MGVPVSDEQAVETFVLFGLQTQEPNSDLSFLDPAHDGQVDADRQVLCGCGQDQLQKTGRLNPGPGLKATARSGQIHDDSIDPTAGSIRKTA